MRLVTTCNTTTLSKKITNPPTYSKKMHPLYSICLYCRYSRPVAPKNIVNYANQTFWHTSHACMRLQKAAASPLFCTKKLTHYFTGSTTLLLYTKRPMLTNLTPPRHNSSKGNLLTCETTFYMPGRSIDAISDYLQDHYFIKKNCWLSHLLKNMSF